MTVLLIIAQYWAVLCAGSHQFFRPRASGAPQGGIVVGGGEGSADVSGVHYQRRHAFRCLCCYHLQVVCVCVVIDVVVVVVFPELTLREIVTTVDRTLGKMLEQWTGH